MNKLLENLIEKLSGKSKKQRDTIAMPMTGELLTLEQVPDPVFAKRMMGEGFAINPSQGKVVAPFAGKVSSIFPTKHALILQSKDGWEVLIHIGIDTVMLQGEGFYLCVEEGEDVGEGTLLLQVDLDKVVRRASSLVSPIVFTKIPEGYEIEIVPGFVRAGEMEKVRIRA